MTTETKTEFEPKTWYGIAWIKDIDLDKIYRVQVNRYGGSTAGYSTIFEVLCIKGIRLIELNAQYFQTRFKGADIHIQFQELDSAKIKELL